MSGEPAVTLDHTTQALVARVAEQVGRLAAVGFAEGATPTSNASRVASIWGTLAIEGNRMSEADIANIMAGRPVAATPRDIREARNAVTAYENLPQWSSRSGEDLLAAHAMLLEGLTGDAGTYRRWGVGVMAKHRVVHVAPKPETVPDLMEELFAWFAHTPMHPLVASSVFHYRFEFIHPFSDGNGRIGRMWQALRLAEWSPIFWAVPVENLVCQHEAEYYAAIAESTRMKDAGPFVRYMVEMVAGALRTCQETDQVGAQVTDQVNAVLQVLGDQAKSSAELMADLGLKHRPTFRSNYLNPALTAGVVERTQPDAPKSPTQRYRVTDVGRRHLIAD